MTLHHLSGRSIFGGLSFNLNNSCRFLRRVSLLLCHVVTTLLHTQRNNVICEAETLLYNYSSSLLEEVSLGSFKRRRTQVIIIIIMDKVKCEKCTFNLPRLSSELCEECQQGSLIEEPAGVSSLTAGVRKKAPPRITEHRLRVFHVDDNDDDTEDHESPTDELKKFPKKCFKLESLSSSRAHLSFPLSSDTIIEEHWTGSNTLTSISLLRVTSSSFDNHPFLIDPSYGDDITKISFEGPCSPKAVSRTLENFYRIFPAVESLEFAPGFFTHEDFHDQDDISPVLCHCFTFTFKSLRVDVDVQKYLQLEESQQKTMELRILSLLNVASEGMKTLSTVDLSLPNTPEVDKALNTFIGNSSNKGVKMVDYDNAEIRYKLDSSSKSENNSKPQIASRKRRASDSSSSPEVEITQLVSKEDKIEHVTLSTSSSDDEEQEQESDKPQFPHIQSSEAFSPLQVADRLSRNSWRDVGGDHTGERDSFDCTLIRIGDYECKSASGTVSRPMIFSDFGIYFQVPHYTDPDQTAVNIGIPIRDITDIKVHFGASKSSIFLKLGLGSTSEWIRVNLGMHKMEERQGHHSPSSKNPCQQFIVFETGMSYKRTQDLFKFLYRSKAVEELDPVHKLHRLQIETLCPHEDPRSLAGQ